MLQFMVWKKFLYFYHNKYFSDTKERVGYFVGISENCGDANTFYILDEDYFIDKHKTKILTSMCNKKKLCMNWGRS